MPRSPTSPQKGQPSGQPSNTLLARHRAEELASALPPLLVAAERVAATVAQGCMGGAASVWARPSGSSAATSRATRRR